MAEFKFLKEREDELKQLENKWNKILFDILKTRYKECDEKLNKNLDLSNSQIPYLLEKITDKIVENKKGRNKFLNLAGPSGVGKGTIGKELEKTGFVRFVRATTRPKRPEEVDGVDYIFLSEEEFHKQRRAGEFLGSFTTYGEWRAIPEKSFFDLIRRNQKFYIDGCAHTALDVIKSPKTKNINFLSIFILPPSFKELIKRLTKRSTEEKKKTAKIDKNFEEKLFKRLKFGIKHLKETNLKADGRSAIDGFVVNDRVRRACQKILQYY